MLPILLLLPFLYVGLDWLNFKVLAPRFYSSFYKDGITDSRAATLIYVLYPWSVILLTRANAKKDMLIKAVVLGLTGYGLYHLTNMATLTRERWPIPHGLAIYDTLWGAVVTVILASVAHHSESQGLSDTSHIETSEK